MPEKNSSDGTLNLNMDIMLQFWKKKIYAMTMHGYRVSPHHPPPPPLGSKIFKISLGLSKVS